MLAIGMIAEIDAQPDALVAIITPEPC